MKTRQADRHGGFIRSAGRLTLRLRRLKVIMMIKMIKKTTFLVVAELSALGEPD
jgi:hypothetical protein